MKKENKLGRDKSKKETVKKKRKKQKNEIRNRT